MDGDRWKLEIEAELRDAQDPLREGVVEAVNIDHHFALAAGASRKSPREVAAKRGGTVIASGFGRQEFGFGVDEGRVRKGHASGRALRRHRDRPEEVIDGVGTIPRRVAVQDQSPRGGNVYADLFPDARGLRHDEKVTPRRTS